MQGVLQRCTERTCTGGDMYRGGEINRGHMYRRGHAQISHHGDM